MEVWKDVAGYEGHYQVSDLGRVKSLERIDANKHRHFERIIKQQTTSKGYMCVHLSKYGKAKWFLVHRLVATAFIEHEQASDVVNHLDNDPKNNNVSNLEWTTYKGNMQWASKQGRMHGRPDNFLKASENRKRPVIATDKNGKEYYFSSQKEAMNALGIKGHGHIASACRKDYGYKTVGGYSWRYADE